MTWCGLDDGQRASATVDMISTVLLTSLNALERADLLASDSKVKNIALVLSMFLALARTMSDAMEIDMHGQSEQQTWPNAIVAYAKGHNIEIKGVYGIDEIIHDFDDTNIADFKNKPGPDRWRFKNKFKEFTIRWAADGSKKNAIGRAAYYITKMSAAERKKYNFDREDPLDKIDPEGLIR